MLRWTGELNGSDGDEQRGGTYCNIMLGQAIRQGRGLALVRLLALMAHDGGVDCCGLVDGGRCGGHDPGKGKGSSKQLRRRTAARLQIILCGDKARTYLFLVEWARQDKTPHAPPEGNKSSQSKRADRGRGHHTDEGRERFSTTLIKITHRQK